MRCGGRGTEVDFLEALARAAAAEARNLPNTRKRLGFVDVFDLFNSASGKERAALLAQVPATGSGALSDKLKPLLLLLFRSADPDNVRPSLSRVNVDKLVHTIERETRNVRSQK